MFENVSKELLEKAMGAATKEEALDILRKGGIELSEEDLQNIAGGEEDGGICWTHKTPCSFLRCLTDKSCISYVIVCTWDG